MNHPNDYESKLDIITSIPAEKISSPVNIPVAVYIQEAEDLRCWCQFDKEMLTANGLDWSIVDDLPARIDTLREAQAKWSMSTGDVVLKARWREITAEAAELRLVLTRTLRFILREDPAAISLIRNFSEGRSHAAVIQSLRDISVFGEMNAELLEAEKFDITKLRRAAELSQELASLKAAVDVAEKTPDERLTIRNQAYTHLEEAVEKIKLHAKFVLWRDPARLKGYASRYTSRKNRRYKQNRRAKELAAVSIDHSSTIDHSPETLKPYPDASKEKTDIPKPETKNLKPQTDTSKSKTKAPGSKTNRPGRETNTLECHPDVKNNYTGTAKWCAEDKITHTDMPGTQTYDRIH